MKKIIAMDNGKYNVKATNGEDVVVFENRYSLDFTEEGFLGNDTFNVTYAGENYTIGSKANTSDTLEGKASKLHVVSTLTTITRLIKSTNCKVILVYGESINKFFNTEHKKTLTSNLEGRHKIIVNGKSFDFEIEIVQILPEGIGHIMSDISKYRGTQYVVDIGGATINFLTVKDGRTNEEESSSYSLGMNSILTKINLALNRADYGDIDSNIILDYIVNGFPITEMQQIADKVIEKHFDEFNKKIGVRGINLNKTPNLTFTGGTTHTLKNKINKYYPNAEIVNEPLISNVKGFYHFGKLKYGNLEVEDEQ